MGARIGVLALQGNVSEHISAFEQALRQRGHDTYTVFPVKRPKEIASCDAVAIPGGESTTISRLIEKNQLYEPIRSFSGGIFATCAGMVLMAHKVDDPRVHPLGLIEITVDRNAFGRQKESFECELDLDGVDGGPFHAIFIRAPVASGAGAGAHVLARLPQGIVAVEQGRHMALAFHPELSQDTRLHERFLERLGL